MTALLTRAGMILDGVVGFTPWEMRVAVLIVGGHLVALSISPWLLLAEAIWLLCGIVGLAWGRASLVDEARREGWAYVKDDWDPWWVLGGPFSLFLTALMEVFPEDPWHRHFIGFCLRIPEDVKTSRLLNN